MVPLGLWLGLLAAVCAERYVLVPNFTFKVHTSSNLSGSVYYQMHTEPTAVDFCFLAWIYLTSAADNAAFVEFFSDPVILKVNWPSTGQATMDFMGNLVPASGSTRPIGKWFHLITGADGSDLFIAVSLRQAPVFQFSGTFSSTFLLETSTVITIPFIPTPPGLDVSHT